MSAVLANARDLQRLWRNEDSLRPDKPPEVVSARLRNSKGSTSAALTAFQRPSPQHTSASVTSFYFQTQKIKYPSDIETKPPARAI